MTIVWAMRCISLSFFNNVRGMNLTGLCANDGQIMEKFLIGLATCIT